LAVLSAHNAVKRAWLARKVVRHLRAVPAYVLIVEFGMLSWVGSSTLTGVASSLPDEVSCLVLNKAANGSAWRQIRKVEGAQIFPAAS
jgi:hypothetical protein